MPTILSGMVDTEDVLADARKIDMSERSYKVQPDTQQFRVMLGKLGSKDAIREKINWLEDEYRPRVSSLAASATSAETTFTVTTGEGNTVFRPGDVVRNMETNEGYLVTAVSANSIGVTRTWGGVAAASSTSAGKLLVVGNASAQGASSGTALVVKAASAYNFTQIQRDPFSFSETQTHIEMYGGMNEPGHEMAKKLVEHTRAIESTLFFGVRDQDASASPGPRGSAGGLLEFISTNVTDASGALTPAEFDTWLEAPLAYGSSNKVVFAAPKVASALSQMLRGIWTPTTTGDRKFGAKVDAFVQGTYGGTIPIVVKREWSDFSATGTNYGTMAFLVDMDNVRLRPLQGRNTHLRRNIEEPSADAETHEYLTEFSLEVAVEKSHAVLKGVTSYAAS